MRRALLVVVVALWGVCEAWAGTITKDTKGFGTTYTTGVYTYGDASNLPSVPQTNSTLATGGANSGTITINGGSDGQPRASTTGKAPIPESGGRSVPVEAEAKVPKSGAGSAARAIGNFARKVITPLAVGSALYDLAKDLGFTASNKPDGEPGADLTRNTETATWRTHGYGQTDSMSVSSSCQSFAAMGAAGPGTNNAWVYVSSSQDTAAHGYCDLRNTVYPGWGTARFNVNRVAVVPGQTQASYEEFEQAVGAMSGFPTNASRALAQAIQAGETVTHETPRVSGPATTAGPVTTRQEQVTKQGANGQLVAGQKTTTTSTTYNQTYNNNTVKVTTTNTINVVVNYQDGTSESSTSSEESEPKKEDTEDPCEAHPDRAGCKELDVPEGEVPKSEKSVAYTQENMGWGGGACPPNPAWTDRLGAHVVDLAPYCAKISSVVRPLVLAFAALMALAIVAPGFRQEE